jgi:hypothetical protein
MIDHPRLESSVAALNPSQLTAVERLVDDWQGQSGTVRLVIVDGPPGTGKTHVAACAAARWVAERQGRVVVLSPTHAAAGVVREKMLSVGFEEAKVLQLKPGLPGYDPQAGVVSFDNIDELAPNLKRQIQAADALITTWHGSRRAFDSARGFLLLIDEVSQVSFAALMAILKRVRPCRPLGFGLLGDPQQLPVIATQEVLATNAAMGVLRRHPECEPCRLDLQYRMNSAICAVVNEVRRAGFGGRPLQAASQEVADQRLDQVTGRYDPQDSRLAEIMDPAAPVVFVDTSGLVSDGLPIERPVGTSWEYEAEARLATLVAKEVRRAFGVGDQPGMAVSSPYAAQVALMRTMGGPNAITIYQAQGHEWDCVVLSLARTTGRTIMDELYQNTYVGLSRARSKLIVFLNVSLFGGYRVFGAILQLVGKVPGIRRVTADPDWVRT